MRILFHHGTPSGIARSLANHEVTEAIERGWERISNGELLTNAEDAGFEIDRIAAAVNEATPGSYAEVEISFK